VRIKEWFYGERGSISSKWVFIRNLPNDVNILVMTDNIQTKRGSTEKSKLQQSSASSKPRVQPRSVSEISNNVARIVVS
jgi:hypothetical protein